MDKLFYQKGIKIVILVLILSFSSCSEDDFLETHEIVSDVKSTKLFFYGNQEDFSKLNDSEVAFFDSKEALKEAVSGKDDYLLFVGSDVDVRSGIINTLRNSGIVVSQLSGKGSADLENLFNDPSFLENNKLFTESQKAKMKELKNKKSNENFSSDNKVPELRLTSYLRNINGDKKIIGGSFANFKQAVEKITEWREDKNKEKAAAKMQSESSSGEYFVEEEEPVEIQHLWVIHDYYDWADGDAFGMFSFTNKSSIGHNGDYSINVNGTSRPYPYTNVFGHKIVAYPGDYYTITKTRMMTLAFEVNSDENKYKYRLEEYNPLNSSNGVLSGSSGSITYGFSAGLGLAQDSSGSLGFDWSSTTDWSRPACEVSVGHNTGPWPWFHALHDINRYGNWEGDTVTSEGSSAFLTRDKETRSSYINYYEVQLYAKSNRWWDNTPRELVVYMYNGVTYVAEYRRGFDRSDLAIWFGPYYW